MGLLRFLMIWLLIATLPMQAMAAATRVTCSAVHGLSAAADVSIQTGLADSRSHVHHAAMPAEDMAAEPASHTASDHSGDHSNHHKNTACGNCGACCIGALALPEALTLAPTLDAASAEIISPSPLVTGFIPDGLERPPRQSPI